MDLAVPVRGSDLRAHGIFRGHHGTLASSFVQSPLPRPVDTFTSSVINALTSAFNNSSASLSLKSNNLEATSETEGEEEEAEDEGVDAGNDGVLGVEEVDADDECEVEDDATVEAEDDGTSTDKVV